jgi:uncharacterized lipoprotein YbaY
VGCGHIDITPPGNPDRVLKGTVNAPAALPAGTEVHVRLVSDSSLEATALGSNNDLPLGDRGRPLAGERILGEQRQTLDAVATEPVPFTIEFRADDSVLRQGINVEVRVSFSGRVRYRTIQAHVVTMASSPFPQTVMVQQLP